MFKYMFIFLVFVPSSAFAHEEEGMMHDAYNMMGFGCAGMSWFWWTLFLVFIVAVFIAVFIIFSHQRKEKDPLSIAKERLAKGEIAKNEFDEIKSKIKEK